jgi:hypothetical protein
MIITERNKFFSENRKMKIRILKERKRGEKKDYLKKEKKKKKKKKENKGDPLQRSFSINKE